jgi:hypothetical protein
MNSKKRATKSKNKKDLTRTHQTKTYKRTNRGRSSKNKSRKARKIKTISQNLLTKFEDVKDSQNVNLQEIFDKMNESGNKMDIEEKMTQEELYTEILNNINKYKQVINFQEEMNKIFISEVHEFLNFFMNFFNQITQTNEGDETSGLQRVKESFSRVEQLVNSKINLFESEKNTTEEKEAFMQILNNFFDFLNENLCGEQDDKPLVDSNTEVKLTEFIEEIKNFVEDLNMNEDFNNTEEVDYYEMECFSNKKNKREDRRRDKLLDTVFMKKSKAKFGEDDEIAKQIEELDLNDKQKRIYNHKSKIYRKVVAKTKKLFLRNFLQIFFVKENGIFSESYFSKVDKNLLSSYKKFRFYKIKFYFKTEETFDDIKKYIEFIRKLFSCHILTYKYNIIDNLNTGSYIDNNLTNSNSTNNTTKRSKMFIKVTISGVGKKQTLMKRLLINFLSADVKHDCLFKISLYSNIFDCMASNLKKFLNKSDEANSDYFYYTNISDNLMKKIISKSEIK